MKKLSKNEAIILAMEIVATAQGGADYLPTIDALEFCISKVLAIPLRAVSFGLAELEVNGNTVTVFKINMVSTLWSPTIKVHYDNIEEEVEKLSEWLYNLTQDENNNLKFKDYEDYGYDDIDSYIEEED